MEKIEAFAGLLFELTVFVCAVIGFCRIVGILCSQAM